MHAVNRNRDCIFRCAARPHQPPLSLEGARSLQAMLVDQLKDDDDAVDAYVAGLCTYMDSPSRVSPLTKYCILT
jgi:hypothetical protein